jgi:hypothetical protein
LFFFAYGRWLLFLCVDEVWFYMILCLHVYYDHRLMSLLYHVNQGCVSFLENEKIPRIVMIFRCRIL